MLLRNHIYSAIRNGILTCEYRPGQELREQVLAERFRVSRSPIRDSLLRLEQENLVTVLPRQGYQVRPILISDVQDIFALQLLLQPACASAAAKADGEAVRLLQPFRGFAMEGKADLAYVKHNEDFHRAVAEASGNKRMAAFSHDLAGQLARLVCVSMQASNFRHVCDASAEQDAIIDAIQAHDAAAAERLARQHAVASQARINDALRLLDEERDQVVETQTPDIERSVGQPMVFQAIQMP